MVWDCDIDCHDQDSPFQTCLCLVDGIVEIGIVEVEVYAVKQQPWLIKIIQSFNDPAITIQVLQ